MAKFSDKWQSLTDWQGRTFPELQLFLRSEGRVRFVTFSSLHQITFIISLSALALWGVIATYHSVTRAKLIEAHNQSVAELENEQSILNTQFGSLEQSLAARAAELEIRQKFLEEIIESDTGLNDIPTLSNPTPSPENIKADAQKIAYQTAPNQNSLSQQQKQPRENTSFLTRLLSLNSDSQNEVSYNDRVKSLSVLFGKLEAHQEFTAKRLIQRKEQELTRINLAIADTNLSTTELVDAWSSHNSWTHVGSAIGGPFIPDQEIKPISAYSNDNPFEELSDVWAEVELAKLALTAVPIGKPAENYYISSKFGRRIDPLKKVAANHPGLDMAGWPGTSILAAAPGKVVHSGWFGPYGNMIEIDHGNGFKTRYGHMKKLRVKKDEAVTQGQKIGDMGKTGRVTDTHLHFEIWFKGKVRDPQPFLMAAENVQAIKADYEKTNYADD